MTERHDFSSTTVSQKNIESTLISQRFFYSKLDNRKEFESITDGFYTSDTLRANFYDSYNMLVNWNISSNLFALITTGSYIMGVSSSLFGLENKFYLDSPFIYNMDALIKSEENMGNSGFEMIYNLDPVMRTKNIFNSVEFITNNITMDAQITSQQLYLLNDWSGSLLSDLDSSELSDLDGSPL